MILITTLTPDTLLALLPGLNTEDSKRLYSKALQACQFNRRYAFMKVLFKNNILSYSGKVDNLVFYWSPRLQRTICRNWVKPTRTQHMTDFGEISRNIFSFPISDGYKQDLRTYVNMFNVGTKTFVKPYANYFNVYTKIMYAMARKHDIDLKTLTYDDIVNDDLPCLTVHRAIQDELIDDIPGSEYLTATM